MAELPESDQQLRDRFNRETSKMYWDELQRHYARGDVIGVAGNIDLIDVALQFARDNNTAVEQWIASESIFKVNDQQSVQWLENKTCHWTVVVAPWVLVQDVDSKLVKD